MLLQIEFTVFLCKKDAKNGEHYQLTIDQIAQRYFRTHEVRETSKYPDYEAEKDVRQFSLARFATLGTHPTKGVPTAHRVGSNITGAYGLAIDIDNKGDTDIYPYIDKFVIRGVLGRYRHILYSTHSHMRDTGEGGARPKYRAVLFFDKVVDTTEYKCIAEHFRKLFPGHECHIDSNSCNITFGWYLPSCSKETLRHAEIIHHSGMLIETDKILAHYGTAATKEIGQIQNDKDIPVDTKSLEHPLVAESSYTHIAENVNSKAQNCVNSNKDFKSSFKASLVKTNNDDIDLKEKVLNVLSEPQMHPAMLSYDEWVKVGGAIKGAGLGIEAWDDWSRLDQAKYRGFAQDILPRWKGFDGRANEGTIFWMARQKGVKHWCGYKTTKQVGVDGKRYTAKVLDYHGEEASRPLTEEEAAKLELVPIDEGHYFPEHLIDTAPEPILMWVDYVVNSNTRPNKTMAFASSLVTFAGLYHHRILGPGRCSPNIYVVGLAGSGKGKAHGIDCTIQFYDRLGIPETAVQTEVPTSGHGIGMNLLSSERSVTYLWAEFQIKFLDEMKGRNTPTFLKQVKNNLLDWYSQTGSRVSLFGANAEGADKPTCWYPHISIYGTAQPELFYKNYIEEGASGGFLARMVPIIGGTKHITPLKRALKDKEDIPEELLEFGRSILSISKGLSPLDPRHFSPKIIHYEDESLEGYYRDFTEAMIYKAEDHEKAGSFLLASLYQRVPHQALKIAMIAHEGGSISRKALEWGIDVASASTDNIINNAILSQGITVYQSNLIKFQKEIKYLQHKFGRLVTKTEISRKCNWLDKTLREKYLAEMKENGMITEVEKKTQGRAALVYGVTRYK